MSVSKASKTKDELRLVITYANGETESKLVRGEPLTIGRGSSSDIIIDENRVSRAHCVIFPLAGALHLKDLGSANGTFVNGAAVTHHVLDLDDVVEIGGATLRLRPVERDGEDNAHETSTRPTITLVEALGVLLNGSRDLSASAKAAVGLLQQLVPAERSFILLASDKQEGRLPVLATAEVEDAISPAPPPSANLAYRVIKSGKAYASINGGTHPTLGHELRGRAVMCAPLEAEGETIGVLYSDSPVGDLEPDEELESIFEGIAAQTALTLASAAEHIRAVTNHDDDGTSTITDADEVPAINPRITQSLRAPIIDENDTRVDELQNSLSQTTAGLVRDAKQLSANLEKLVRELASQPPGSKRGQTAHKATLNAVRRLAEMTEAFRLTVSTEEVAVDLLNEELELSLLTRSVVEELLDDAALVNVDLALGRVDAMAWVIADRDALNRALDTIIGRSIAFATPGGQVRVSCLNDDATVNIVVEESGSEEQSDARTRMLIAWSNQEKPNPSDLGAMLTAARLTAEAHGGRLLLTGDRTSTRWSMVLPASGSLDYGDSDEATEVVALSPEMLEYTRTLSAERAKKTKP